MVSAFSRIPQHSTEGRQLNPLTSGRSETIIIQSNQFARRRRVKSFSELSSIDNDVCTKSSDSDEGDVNGMSTYYNHLLSQFQGDFDNYNQGVQDRIHELTPGEGGGHEHIHCTLLPCPQYNNTLIDESSSQWILAAFYFNGNPRQIFRFRLYEIIKPSVEEVHVRMKLNTLLPNLEKELRECSDQPCIWWNVVWGVWCKENNKIDVSVDEEGWNRLQTKGMPTLVSPLEGCDVLWEPNWDKSKHPYLYVNEYDDDKPTKSLPDYQSDSAVTQQAVLLPTGQSYHATMEAGSKGAIIDSISMIPGKRILIKDELSLWKDEFWINDRGYDPDADSDDTTEKQETDSNKTDSETSMPFVYGNRRGVPYKLQRVSNFRGDTSLGIDRVTSSSDLEWTLGDDYRTSDLFEKKMQHIENAHKV